MKANLESYGEKDVSAKGVQPAVDELLAALAPYLS